LDSDGNGFSPPDPGWAHGNRGACRVDPSCQQFRLDPFLNRRIVLPALPGYASARSRCGMLTDPQVQHHPHLQRGEEYGQENQRDGKDRLKGFLSSLGVKSRPH
jgi:hypothetical protein